MKFSEFWNVVLSIFEREGIDFNAYFEDKQKDIKEAFRDSWLSGETPEESYFNIMG